MGRKESNQTNKQLGKAWIQSIGHIYNFNNSLSKDMLLLLKRKVSLRRFFPASQNIFWTGNTGKKSFWEDCILFAHKHPLIKSTDHSK